MACGRTGFGFSNILRYERTARRFLQQREDAVGSRFIEDLAGKDVVSFLLQETARASVGTAKGRVAELRSLLRFLYLKKVDAGAVGGSCAPRRRLA